MYGLVSSVIINVILFSVLVFVNRKEKEKQERIKKVKTISERILNNQIAILRKGEYNTNSLELEMAKYMKDVLLTCMITGDLGELEKSRLHEMVLAEYPDIFSMPVGQLHEYAEVIGNTYEESESYRNSARKQNDEETIRAVRENISKDFAANRTELKTMVEASYNTQFLENVMRDD